MEKEYKDFLRAMALQKLAKTNVEEYDTSIKLFIWKNNSYKVDAFVAMGGNPDKSGYVNASELIKIIKDEFKMTIDIEVFLSDPIIILTETNCWNRRQ